MKQAAPDDEQLEEFLEAQEQDGRSMDTGSFTLNPKLAREKLRQFQLQDPSLFVAKAVQAAEQSGAPWIEFKIGRRRLTLEFLSEDPDLSSPDRLMECISDVHSLSDTPIRHLAVAVVAASSAQLSSLRWETPNGTVVVTDSVVEKTDHTSTTLRLVVDRRVKLLSWLFGTAFVDEIRVLDTRCGYGSCQVEFDGRKVKPQGWSHFTSHRTDNLGLVTPRPDRSWLQAEQKNLVERYRRGSRGPLLKEPDHTKYQRLDEGNPLFIQEKQYSHSSSPWLLWLDSQIEPATSIAITPNLSGPAQIGFVKHGVLLNNLTLQDWGHPGALIIHDGSHLTTDLTEFQIVENKIYRETLSSLENTVKETTEQVTRELLTTVFRNGGLPPSHNGDRLKWWFHWLRNHQAPVGESVEALVDLHFLNHSVSKKPVHPNLELVVRKAHSAHLDPSEEIVLVYNDALVGDSSNGFLITGQKLCWCPTLDKPRYLFWEELNHVEILLNTDEISIGGSKLSTALNKEMAGCLHGFLTSMKASPHFHQRELPQVLEFALKHLGKPSNVYYHPHIPNDKLRQALGSFGEPLGPDEHPLLVFDGTVFGGSDNGFLITERRICWRNIMEETESFTWAELKPEEIAVHDSGATLRSKRLHVHVQAVREGLGEFLRAAAAFG